MIREGDGEFKNLFEKYNKEYWRGKAKEEDFMSVINLENFCKAVTLQVNVEKIGYQNYDRYHWILETTSVADVRYCNYSNQVEVDGYLGYILKHDGNVDAAFQDLMGDAEVFIDYANDIASTAF
jgi:hypothetical protein